MARGDRVAAKVALAHRILCALSSSDPHCRLIHLAILRRDEVLLDGIVTELGALLSGERPAARTTPPPSGLSQRRR